MPSVPAPVVAAAWRGHPRQDSLARMLAGCEIEAMTSELACRVGEAAGRAPHEDALMWRSSRARRDGTMMSSSRRMRLTSARSSRQRANASASRPSEQSAAPRHLQHPGQSDPPVSRERYVAQSPRVGCSHEAEAADDRLIPTGRPSARRTSPENDALAKQRHGYPLHRVAARQPAASAHARCPPIQHEPLHRASPLRVGRPAPASRPSAVPPPDRNLSSPSTFEPSCAQRDEPRRGSSPSDAPAIGAVGRCPEVRH